MKMLFALEVSGCVLCVKESYTIIYNKFSKQLDCNGLNLKLVSAIFYQICIFSPNDSPLKL